MKRPSFQQTLLFALVCFAIASCDNKTATDSENGEPEKGAKASKQTANGKPAEKKDDGRKLTKGGKPPQESDKLQLYYPDDPDTLNLLTSNDSVSTTFQRFVYEALGEQRFDDPDKWDPGLAESWKFDPETLTYTFNLRKGVMWHPFALPNGKEFPPTEMTAKDVKFTWDCILNPFVEAASYRSYYENPNARDDSEKYKVKVRVKGKYKVEVQWTEPYFLSDMFTLGTPVIPHHVYSVDKNGDPISFRISSKEFADGFNNHWANQTMCGTGPMIFKEWKKEQRVTLERNPNYWGEPFYFDRIVYSHIANPNTAYQKTMQGELDWGSISEKDQYMQSKEHANVKSGKVILADFISPSYRYVGYNQKNDFFKDRLVRQALSHAIPIDDIIEKIYYGLANRTTGPFLPGSAAYDATIKPIPFDLKKSAELLDEAGWKDSDSDGLRDKMVDGTKVNASFDLMIYSDAPQYKTIAEIIKENMRKVGIDVQISPTKWALMLQKLRKKEFDACILGWESEWKGDPFQIWHGSQADTPDSSNSISYKNPEVDKLIEELRVTLDADKQTELFHKIHRILYEDQPYTFLFMDKATVGYNSRIQNVKFYRTRPPIDVREWYTTEPR